MIQSQVIIRQAEPKDQKKIAVLFEQFYSRFNMEQTLTGQTKELLRVDNSFQFAHDTIESYLREKKLLFVAEQGEEILGFLSGEINTDPHMVYSPEAEIIDWYVTESHRAQGIGRLLYDAFVVEIKKYGCKAIAVEAFYENVSTISTYERMGFVKDSVLLKKKV